MSGPKRGYWRIRHDPTPQRLRDLRSFVGGQDVWLRTNGQLLRRYLGEAAYAQALAARKAIDDCIAARDADGGFDAYGRAWSLFNRLHQAAWDAKRQQQRQERARQRQVASGLVAACREDWAAPQHRAVLARWADPARRRRLESDLRTMGRGSAEQVGRRARAWQQAFDRELQAAGKRAAENAEAVRVRVPALQEAGWLLGELNVEVLPAEQRDRFGSARTKLQQDGESAVSQEQLAALEQVMGQLKELANVYEPKVRQAELAKAAGIWQAALEKCGYSVSCRRGGDGGVILQASGFPLKTVSMQMRPGSGQVELEVNGKQGHGRCVEDVRALQAELARGGMELTMTDWGSGKPASVGQQVTRGVAIGGGQ